MELGLLMLVMNYRRIANVSIAKWEQFAANVRLDSWGLKTVTHTELEIHFFNAVPQSLSWFQAKIL